MVVFLGTFKLHPWILMERYLKLPICLSYFSRWLVLVPMLEFPGCSSFEGFHLSCTRINIRRLKVCQVDLLSWDSSPSARNICLDFFFNYRSRANLSCDAWEWRSTFTFNGGVTQSDLYGWSTVHLSNFYHDIPRVKMGLNYLFANCNQQFHKTRGTLKDILSRWIVNKFLGNF